MQVSHRKSQDARLYHIACIRLLWVRGRGIYIFHIVLNEGIFVLHLLAIIKPEEFLFKQASGIPGLLMK